MFQQTNHYLYQRIGKRCLDILGSMLLLIVCTPLLFLFSIILLLFSGRPILFKQARAGINNASFTIWKFRTMDTESEESSSHQYEWLDEVPKDFSFAKPDHLNITTLGKIYRKFSIDEIPQLWNVLKGDMSFIGPRPEMVEITNCYSNEQKKRLLVKPGITGYAQVHGRSQITHGEKVVHDLYYVHHCSFLLDIKIVIRTILIVITGKGAH
ncbi:sugar transferase [Psychrobacillus glaciei]|uniref:Sugar transferase n=2 Tax=Psychrobacillus glaciei TaxID=2283160 RepID=A0A5J6SXZ4_9BACI|nr:sugar transferase [Psychrobacillus glaciei]